MKLHRSLFGAAALAAALVTLAGCRSTGGASEPSITQEPIPEIVENEGERQPPPGLPAGPHEYLVITGSKVNLRRSPGTDGAPVGQALRGERLLVVGQQGEWYEVRLANGAPAFVSTRYARKDGDCPPDTAAPRIVSSPMLDLSEGATHGVVQLRLAVDAEGGVSNVEVLQNGTGDAALAERAAEEARKMRFAPFIRKCRATPFSYVFSRMF